MVLRKRICWNLKTMTFTLEVLHNHTPDQGNTFSTLFVVCSTCRVLLRLITQTHNLTREGLNNNVVLKTNFNPWACWILSMSVNQVWTKRLYLQSTFSLVLPLSFSSLSFFHVIFTVPPLATFFLIHLVSVYSGPNTWALALSTCWCFFLGLISFSCFWCFFHSVYFNPLYAYLESYSLSFILTSSLLGTFFLIHLVSISFVSLCPWHSLVFVFRYLPSYPSCVRLFWSQDLSPGPGHSLVFPFCTLLQSSNKT